MGALEDIAEATAIASSVIPRQIEKSLGDSE